MSNDTKILGVPTSVPDVLNEGSNKNGIIVIVSFLVLLIVVILIWIYAKYMYKSKYYKNTVFYRFEEFSKLSVSKFTLTLVIAYLVATVVNGFNRSIMIPIVQSLFPSEDVWGTGVSLPRGAVMYPGLFFLLVVSFFLSLLVVFILAELVYQLLRILTAREEGDAKVAGVVILVGLLIGLMAWNIVDMEHPEKPHITTVPPNIITSELGKKHAIKIREPVNEYKKLLGMASL